MKKATLIALLLISAGSHAGQAVDPEACALAGLEAALSPVGITAAHEAKISLSCREETFGEQLNRLMSKLKAALHS
jgi:hypothetical protein